MKVLIAGDFCDQYRVSEIIEKKEYHKIFSHIRDYINSADYSFINFEFPIVVDECDPIQKCGPNLNGHPEAVDAIKYAGFNCCSLANNHILDQGEECLLATKNRIEEAGIKTVGAGGNLAEASEILYLKKDEQTVAVINCCEHEFSIATANTSGANPLDPIQQFYKIQEAKNNADHVLVIVHGGHEHYQLPSLRMQDTYRFFIDAGADAVVNHHQHCISGYEIYNSKPIFYGLGNFLFDHISMQSGIWTEGYMVALDFKKNNVSFRIIPYKQCTRDFVGVRSLNIEEHKRFTNMLDSLNRIIGNRNELNQNLDTFYSNSVKDELLMMEPYTDTILYQLFKRGLLPTFFRGGRKLKIENHIICESHREKLIYALKETR